VPGPYPLATLAPTIDAVGITAPPFEDILASLTASYQQIYGSDTYLAPDSQDGQWIAVQAQAIYDQNQAMITAYLSYSPAFAQGVGLSSVVKINGLQRRVPSYSSAALLLVGQAGTIIDGGIVGDVQGFQWALPATVTIPVTGEILVTAVCMTVGDVKAEPDSIINIITQQPGWQTVTNPESAFAGLPVETDAPLRRRQTGSTSLVAITPRESIYAALANISGVGRVYVYDNDTDYFNSEGIPQHSICAVIEAGDATLIAETIAIKKNPGCGTFGDVKVVVFDQHGVPNTINFFYLDLMPIFVRIALEPMPGYLETTGELIIAAIAAYLNTLAINEHVYVARLYAPANLAGDEALVVSGLTQPQLDALSATYVIRGIEIGTAPDALSILDIVIPFDAAASCNPATVTINLQPR
jgi:uncharacterized phage protein gp47/JayE